MARVVNFIYLLLFILLMSNLVNPSSSYSESKQNLESTLSNDDMATPDLKSYRGKRVKLAEMMEMNKRFADGDEPGEERKGALELAVQMCRPYPAIVKVETPEDQKWRYWPSHVELHRCAGGCYSDSHGCTVEKEDEVTILVQDINNPKHAKTLISLKNHTRCECSCKQSKCTNRKKTFITDSCSCECIENGSHCNEKDNKKWNDECECECLINKPCHYPETWNNSSCKCETEHGTSVPAF